MTIQDGIHLRGSSVPYDTIDAVNYSTLKHCAKSARHYQHALQARSSSTPSMRRGSLVHTAILEPHLLATDYVVYDGDRRGPKWTAFKEEHSGSGAEIVKAADMDVAMAMRDAVHADSVAGPIVRSASAREPTLVWTDEETGLRCKGRPDVILDCHEIVDLKTAASISPFDFARSVARYQYHVQAAYYLDGYEQITIRRNVPYVIIAVESCAPYDVIVYELGDDVLGPGRDEYRRMLKMVSECRVTGAWPGYAAGCPMPLELPPWARADEDDLTALGLE